MTTRLSRAERRAVAAFALLGIATGVAMLGDLQLLPAGADHAAVAGLVGRLLGLLPG